MKKPFDEKKVATGEGMQVLKVKVESFEIFNVYRSSNGCKEELCENLSYLIEAQKPSIVCGDLNLCGKMDKNNKVTRLLENLGFNQLVKEATHIRGRQIDHVFFRGSEKMEVLSIDRYSPYYSDHDALLVCLKPRKPKSRLRKRKHCEK